VASPEDAGAFVLKKIGIFGGSFDPIHFGHLNLAIQMLERAPLDEILFCPALYSPFKEHHRPVASPEHRLAMLKLILTPFFRVTSIELDRPGPSFTIDTLRELGCEKGGYQLLLSEESAAQLHAWKDSSEIVKLAPPLVGSRTGEGKHTIQTPLFDISSTEVRRRLKKKLYCKHLVPSIVLDYIEEFGLYSNA
jgi:nicotinate-nucleotide adenylyltransferase